MTWRDQLRPASFRGIAFDVLNDQGNFGRRTVLHEYPFRDLPASEDLGRRAREMRISAIIIGDDYMDRRDALIQAVEEEGTGKLVHPQYGELDVNLSADGLVVDHSITEGGCCRISFSCIETGEFRFPSAQAVTQDVVRDRASEAGGSLLDAFAKGFSLDNLPGWAQADAIQRAQQFLDRVQGAIAPIANIAANTGLLSLITSLSPQLGFLLDDGRGFADQVRGIFSMIRGSTDSGTAARVLDGFANFGDGDEELRAVTTTRRQVSANRTAIVELVKAGAVIERATALADLEFIAFNDAVATRDSVIDQIDAVADITIDDALYGSLTALRAAVVRDVAARGADLSRLATISRTAATPALVLAYDLYEDTHRDAEIILRNGIAHPGAIAAGQLLEVLSD